MKISGVHIVILISAAVIGLVVYGGAKKAAPVTSAAQDSDAFLQEVKQTADKVPSTEEGIVPPDQKVGEVPVIALEPEGDVDFGVVRRDDTSEIEVKVVNKGTAPLKVIRITTTCGCTQAKMEEKDKTIAPGKSAPLKIIVDPRRIAGTESRKSVTINSNDPATPGFKFDVIAKIDPEYVLEPAKVDFGEVQKGQTPEKVLLLRQLIDDPIEIKQINSMARNNALNLTHELRPKDQWLDANKPEYDVHVKLNESVPLGPFSARFTILTTCKRRPEIPVTATAVIKSWYSVTPARMLIVREKPLPGQEQQTKAIISADRPFEISDVNATIEGLKAEVQPGEDANSKVLLLSVEPGSKANGKIEYLNFNLTSGDQTVKETLEVRVIPSAPRVDRDKLKGLVMPQGPASAPAPASATAVAPAAPATPAAPTAPATPEATPAAPAPAA